MFFDDLAARLCWNPWGSWRLDEEARSGEGDDLFDSKPQSFRRLIQTFCVLYNRS